MNSKPASELDKKRENERIAMQNAAIKFGLWHCCTKCENFDAKTEVCLMFKARPPAHIITVGCEEFFYIPF